MNKWSNNPDRKIRILLVDDHIAMRMGIASAIEHEPDMVVIAEAGNGMEAVSTALEKRPDVVILDLRMPEQGGIETIRILKKEWERCNVLVYSSYANGEEIFNAFQAGADGFVVKDMELDLLLEAIRTVAGGDRYIPPEISSRMIFRFTSKLTPREITILECVAHGLSNKEVADKLNLVEGTVKVHLANIYKKLKVNDRTQAVMFAIKNHIIQVD
ncbi:MAG: response regulator transcription factor [Puniceicoccaceae bacterium]